MADIGPERVQLAPFELIIGQEALFDGFCVLSGRPEPSQDGIFFMAFHPRQTAHAHTFGEER